MWKRDEAVRPPQPVSPPAPAPVPEPSTPRTEPIRQERVVVNIGKSVVIKGELTASEDLTIEAQVVAKTVVVEGQVQGNVTATERIDIRDKGSVEGDLSAPRVAIADGAHFRGSIDMQQAKAGDKAHDAKPSAAASTPSSQPS